jgi:hypothetical protein
MLASVYAKISLLAHVLVLGFAFWRGSVVVKKAALVVLTTGIVAMAVQDQLFTGADFKLLWVATAQLAALAYLAFEVRRGWILTMCAFSLTTIMLHLAKAVGDHVEIFPYLTLVVLTSYGNLATLLFATVREDDDANTIR